MGSLRCVRAIGVAVALAVLGGPALTGCAAAPGEDAVVAAAGYEDVAKLPYNLVDVLFSREMILHYRQGVTMARLAPGRGRDPFVLSLAADVLRDDPARVGPLAASLTAWEFSVPDADKPPLHQMEGMLSPAQLLLLKKRSGAEFDRLWLTAFARHTDYGVRLAEKAGREGKDGRTVELARAAAAVQRARLAGIVEHLKKP
ncbi:hypothetical protein Sme01_72780 [Sphaerisporangium melleum]|uniref:DUF305 domain-containing protein n=1 Tax=Sphaerisporangium melleum TaxID=321316 RepID=A0A917RRG0_9ACTN|nr:DUF305 domain-containing protein [Sphaerisporangium melleum]GGL18580.1 hypothetical protein GCM10007964_70760 [Sphaerisporangium melleum]GII74802.1 hypothetical protein Sme01_72780 [Sphaerisporangium melleum]